MRVRRQGNMVLGRKAQCDGLTVHRTPVPYRRPVALSIPQHNGANVVKIEESHPPPGRKWAKAGTALGAVASEGGNIGHSIVSGHPDIGAIAFSALWPIMLFVCFEVMVTAQWPEGKVWVWVRWAGMSPVVMVAFMVSWVHISYMLSHYGENIAVSWAGPVAIDAMMVLCSAALMAPVLKPAPVVVAPPVLRKVAAPRKAPVVKAAPAPRRRAVRRSAGTDRPPVAVTEGPAILSRQGRAQARDKVDA